MPRLNRRVPTHLLLTAAVTMTSALALGVAGCNDTEGGDNGVCVSTEQYFAENFWANIGNVKCAACHNAQGAANKSNMVFKSAAEGGYLEANLEMVKKVAAFEQNGKSLFLLKPTKQVEHEGGEVIAPGSDEEAALEGLVEKIKNDDGCVTNQAQFFSGVMLFNARQTLVKAAIALGSRLPTDEEYAQVEKGSWGALDTLLEKLMTEDAFYERLKESWNDQLKTDFYVATEPNFQFDDDAAESQYYKLEWYREPGNGIFDIQQDEDGNGEIVGASAAALQKYGATSVEDLAQKIERWTREGVGREPLEIISHIVRNNKPFTEVVTAPYTVMNPFSARAFSAYATFQNDANPNEFIEATVGYGAPHAGVLSTQAMLQKWPTTPTNRNRARARIVLENFLATDILKAAERPINGTDVAGNNPTMSNPACVVCHAKVDPLSGLYNNYQDIEDNNGESSVSQYRAAGDWFIDMRDPGFSTDVLLPPDRKGEGLVFLGENIAKDERFSFSVVYQVYRMLSGQDPLVPPTDPNAANFKGEFEAYLGQYYTFSRIAKTLRESGYNYKVAVKEMILSPYFRATNTAENIAPEQLKKFGALGLARLLTPEEMTRKIANVLHVEWRNEINDDPRSFKLLNPDEYQLLVGGIDNVNVTKRGKEVSGIVNNVYERMGNELACTVVGNEFAIGKDGRAFFTGIDANIEPADANGFELPQNAQMIKEQLKLLNLRILGEQYDAANPEIERQYKLFLDVWTDGKKAMKIKTPEGEEPTTSPVGETLPGNCVSGRNYLTGAELPKIEEGKPGYGDDKLYTKRAWMAVVSYLLSDQKFIFN